MSSDKALIDSFISIVGNEVTEDEAERFLKMGKNNLEAALNYFFNKKVKSEKPAAQPPSNAFQKLQQGSKKQAHVERIIKDLRHDFSSKEIQPSNINLDKPPDTLKVSKYPNPKLDRQSSSFSALNTSTMSDSAATNSQVNRSNDNYTPIRESGIRSQFSATKLSDKMEEEKVEYSEDNKPSMEVEKSIHSSPTENKTTNNNETSSQEGKLRRSTRVRKPPTPIYSPLRTERSPLRSESSPARSEQMKSLKRNFDQFQETQMIEDIQPIPESIEEENTKMIEEENVQDSKWPKYLGKFVAKAHIMSSFHRDMEEGIIDFFVLLIMKVILFS